MKTNIKNLAAFLATAIWADGEYDEAEKVALSEIAEALEVNEEELVAETEAAQAELDKMDEEEVSSILSIMVPRLTRMRRHRYT